MNDLRRCVEQLMGARASLKASQAKESAAVCAIIESTIMTIGPLYDRCEPAFEAIKARAQERAKKARERGDLGQILRADKLAARMGGEER